jgi:hypothetical protein
MHRGRPYTRAERRGSRARRASSTRCSTPIRASRRSSGLVSFRWWLRAAVPDGYFTLKNVFAENDRVANHQTFRGTHRRRVTGRHFALRAAFPATPPRFLAPRPKPQRAPRACATGPSLAPAPRSSCPAHPEAGAPARASSLAPSICPGRAPRARRPDARSTAPHVTVSSSSSRSQGPPCCGRSGCRTRHRWT